MSHGDWAYQDNEGQELPGSPAYSDLCGAPAGRGLPCIMPKGHNRGNLDIPENHRATVNLGMGQSDGSFSIGTEVWPGVAKLIEEMGELNQVLGKLIASRGGSDHWDGSDLHDRLIEEMGDVKAALSFVASGLTGADRIAIDKRVVRKVDLFRTWHRQWQESRR